jgi:SAM-dependent methyltransferase
MESFAPDWLALREAYDAASRSRPLARAFLAALPRRARIADLGCGRGANACYLAGFARRDPRWRLVEGDARLLAQARDRLPGGETRCADLAHADAGMLLRGCGGVTASALCDLVSGAWIDGLVRAAARRRLPLLFALSVDGRVVFAPEVAEDAAVLAAFRRDQRRDKGFGPALGPAAPFRIARALRRHGYAVRMVRSDWRLGPGDNAMLRAVTDGFAAVAPADSGAWRGARARQIAAGALTLRVGHVDILGLPDARAGMAASRAVNLP